MSQYYPAPSNSPFESSLDVARPLFDCRIWIKLLGTVYFIVGVLQCLTIVGIVVGWLPIWLGTCFWTAASRIEEGFQTGNAFTVQSGMQSLKTAFTILGVLMLIVLVLMVLYILALVGFLMLGISSASIPR